MPKNTFKLPVGLEIQRLTNFYRPTINKMTGVSQVQSDNFFNLVVPALADPKVIIEKSDSPRYFCFFTECKKAQKSFASKQKFIQHLTILHDQELPQGGKFIAPNDNSTTQGGFWCSNCGHHYCRRDHLQNHFRTSLHCKNATILEKNPLETKELEYNELLKIEYTKEEKNLLKNEFNKTPNNIKLPTADNFTFKPKLLAIEWKSFVKEEQEQLKTKEIHQETFTNPFKKLLNNFTKSFSSLTLSTKSKPKLKKKSSTCHCFLTNNFPQNNTTTIFKKEKRCIDDVGDDECFMTKKLMTKKEINLEIVKESKNEENTPKLKPKKVSFQDQNLEIPTNDVIVKKEPHVNDDDDDVDDDDLVNALIEYENNKFLKY